ncbi:UNVERIFIED_CONTAM: hypothetical protein FKN15_007020 [Acipenser sinensis]
MVQKVPKLVQLDMVMLYVIKLSFLDSYVNRLHILVQYHHIRMFFSKMCP